MTHLDGGKFTLGNSREVLAMNGLILGEMSHIFTEMFAGRGVGADPYSGGVCGSAGGGEELMRFCRTE